LRSVGPVAGGSFGRLSRAFQGRKMIRHAA
jgi:hypothetical protein